MSKTHKDARSGAKSASKRKFADVDESTSKKPRKSPEAKKHEAAKLGKKPQTGVAAKDRAIDLDDSIAMKDPALLADFFAQKIAKHYKDSSTIEQHDLSIPKSWLRETTEFDLPHTAINLPTYLEKFTDGGKTALSSSEIEASPHTIIIASSGIRVADLIRQLRVYTTEHSKVAKLIAKHMKLKENIDYLAKTKVGIAVGTPARLKDLVEQDGLKTAQIKTIVIDVSYLDEKKRSVLDDIAVFGALLQFLHHEKIEDKLNDSSTERRPKILVF